MLKLKNMVMLVVLALTGSLTAYADDTALARLPRTAQLTGHVAASTSVSFALTLPVRDPDGLRSFLDRIYDPADPEYHHFITPEQFAERFGPTVADYEQLQATAMAAGLTITGTYASRTVLDVAGPAAAVESLLSVRLNNYTDAAGSRYRIADRAAALPRSIAGLGANVVGLDSTPAARPHIRLKPSLSPMASPVPVGMSPSQIKKAYSIPTALTGAGQTIALFELDGYQPSDIQQYRNQYGISGTPLQNILVDGASGAAGIGANEVVLDIDMVLAMVPNGAGLLVYETVNSGQGLLDGYARIANDNRAKVVSTSWGLAENAQSRSLINSESTIFAQMATQGQSVFSATGDTGAYDNVDTPQTLTVDDPASQPYVTGVGGTTLNTDILGHYASETVWNRGSDSAGGGGVSTVWPMPAYQKNTGLNSANRMVPDVSFDADPNTGYAIYFTDPQTGAGWIEVGGTSAAAPLWGGLVALINQQRVANGMSLVGFANQTIYSNAGSPAKYARDYHDIADGSNNLYYTAVPGFDEATGWGTPIGSSLIADLTRPAPAATGTVHTFTSGVKLFSIPYDYSGLNIASVFDQPVALYWWDPLTAAYVSSPTPPVDTVHQMVAYWAKFNTSTNVKNDGVDLTTSPSGAVSLTTGQSSLTREIYPGWNLLGNPFNVTVPLSNVTISPINGGSSMTLAQANANGYAFATLYSYDPSTNKYVAHTTDSLAPYTGYWIKAFNACKVTVTHP